MDDGWIFGSVEDPPVESIVQPSLVCVGWGHQARFFVTLA
jgi:hypothetical protein